MSTIKLEALVTHGLVLVDVKDCCFLLQCHLLLWFAGRSFTEWSVVIRKLKRDEFLL